MASNADPIGAAPGLPDAPGADVLPGANGLPPLSALTPRARLVVGASAIGDIALRTWVASLLATTVTPIVAATSMLRTSDERGNLRFYAELAAEQDSDKSFPPPTRLPRVSSRPAGRLAARLARGTVDNISFPSSFTAINPAMRKRWDSLGSNNIVRAQHWRHDDGPRPTLCVIHGFMGSSYLANGRFFSLPWYYRAGYDVLMFTLPFHGRRAERLSPFSGFGFFAGGLGGFAEAMAQAVHDFRSVIDYLRHTGVDRIALTGMSLGGYTSALVAAVDDRLEAVIPNCPVVTPAMMFDEWFPANKMAQLGFQLYDISRAQLDAGLSYHCPLNYRPRIPRDRRMIITGLADRMAPPEQALMLWNHWDRCALHWFPGSHVLHVSQLDYLRRMTDFLHGVMFD